MRAALTSFAALLRKELLAVLKDPANRIILIVPVILQSLLFGYAATYDLVDVPYALYDESRSVASARLVARLEGTGVFQRVAGIGNNADLARSVENGDALMVLHIAADFERRLLAGEPAPVQLILDARNSTTASSAPTGSGSRPRSPPSPRRSRTPWPSCWTPSTSTPACR